MDIFQVYQIEDFALYLVAFVVIFSGFLSIVYVIWGGFQLVLSGGNEEKVKKAINSMRFSIFGVLVLIGIVYIFPLIGDLVGLPISEYITPERVFSTTNNLVDYLMQPTNHLSPEFSLDDDIFIESMPDDFIDL